MFSSFKGHWPCQTKEKLLCCVCVCVCVLTAEMTSPPPHIVLTIRRPPWDVVDVHPVVTLKNGGTLFQENTELWPWRCEWVTQMGLPPPLFWTLKGNTTPVLLGQRWEFSSPRVWQHTLSVGVWAYECLCVNVCVWSISNTQYLIHYSFSQLLKHYNQAFELKFQNHNSIYQKAHPFP